MVFTHGDSALSAKDSRLRYVWGAQAAHCAVEEGRCSFVEDIVIVSDGPILRLFTTCVSRLVRVLRRGVGTEVTVYEGQVAHFQPRKIERVRDGSGLDRDHIHVVGCGPFTVGELDLDCEALYGRPVDFLNLLEHWVVSDECEESPGTLLSHKIAGKMVWCL